MPFSFRLNAYLGTVLGHFPCFYVLISKSKPKCVCQKVIKFNELYRAMQDYPGNLFFFYLFQCFCLFISKLVRVI